MSAIDRLEMAGTELINDRAVTVYSTCPHCGEPYPCTWTRAAFSKAPTTAEADRLHTTPQPCDCGVCLECEKERVYRKYRTPLVGKKYEDELKAALAAKHTQQPAGNERTKETT